MWTCTCTCVLPWSTSRCRELRSSLGMPGVLESTYDTPHLCWQKRVVSRVEYGAVRGVLHWDEDHPAPPQKLRKANKRNTGYIAKEIATHCCRHNWKASENVRTPEHVSQGAAKLAARANSLQLLRLPSRGFLSRSCGYERNFWTSRKLRSRGRKSFKAHSQPNIMERGRAENSLSTPCRIHAGSEPVRELAKLGTSWRN